MNKLTRYADIELRSLDDRQNHVEGYAAVFSRSADLGWFTEEIDPRAFDNADMSDVVLNFNHDDSYLLAGTRNGSLRLQVRDMGLYQDSDIIDTTQGQDIMKLVRSGLISKMSFSFTIDAENDGEYWETRDGKEHRIIRRVGRLFDVSLVTFPAYPTTSVFARSQSDDLAETHRQLMIRRREQDRRMAELFKEKQ